MGSVYSILFTLSRCYTITLSRCTTRFLMSFESVPVSETRLTALALEVGRSRVRGEMLEQRGFTPRALAAILAAILIDALVTQHMFLVALHRSKQATALRTGMGQVGDVIRAQTDGGGGRGGQQTGDLKNMFNKVY